MALRGIVGRVVVGRSRLDVDRNKSEVEVGAPDTEAPRDTQGEVGSVGTCEVSILKTAG